MKKIFLILGFLALAACTPADERYCQGFGVAGTPEFGKCLSYYHQQEAAFGGDLGQCAIEADETYPRSLYDDYHTEYVRVIGHHGFAHTEAVTVAPDYYHNQQVDALRMRIIGPCMQARGWNSPNSWQAGRQSVKPQRRARTAQMEPKGGGLPWLK